MDSPLGWFIAFYMVITLLALLKAERRINGLLITDDEKNQMLVELAKRIAHLEKITGAGRFYPLKSEGENET